MANPVSLWHSNHGWPSCLASVVVVAVPSPCGALNLAGTHKVCSPPRPYNDSNKDNNTNRTMCNESGQSELKCDAMGARTQSGRRMCLKVNLVDHFSDAHRPPPLSMSFGGVLRGSPRSESPFFFFEATVATPFSLASLSQIPT